jgi:hypothetical protein
VKKQKTVDTIFTLVGRKTGKGFGILRRWGGVSTPKDIKLIVPCKSKINI